MEEFCFRTLPEKTGYQVGGRGEGEKNMRGEAALNKDIAPQPASALMELRAMRRTHEHDFTKFMLTIGRHTTYIWYRM